MATHHTAPLWRAVLLGFLVILADGRVTSNAAPQEPERKGQRIVVVVNRQNPVRKLALPELRRIFLRDIARWPNGWTITVMERSTDNQIREEFSKRVLGKGSAELAEYWLNLRLTRGLKPPQVCRSAKLIKESLTRIKGGIGYVYENELDDTVQRIEVSGLE